MSFFISDAMAEGAGAAAQQGDAGFMGFLPLIIIFVLFYFLLIRPQSKRQKEHKQMVEALTKGDEVVTSGGMLGKTTEVGDTFITIEVAEGVEVKVQRSAVASLLPKGTINAKES